MTRKEICARYREKNRLKVQAAQKRWRKQNPEKQDAARDNWRKACNRSKNDKILFIEWTPPNKK